MRLVFFGPPGIGKGTQATLLARRRDLAHISTGAIIRAAIKADTPLGREARTYVDDGRLAPDELVRDLAETAMAEHGYDDFILDGYPRTLVQARWLTAFLEAHQAPLNAVISLQVPTEIIVERLSRRRVHKVTGENYHLDFNPPPVDIDPALIIQREDDRPAAIRERLEIYHRETEPVVAYYQGRDIFHEIDGVGEIEEVYERIERVVRGAVAAK